jgi:predicted amidophosphoribosyltransferase
VARGLFAAFFPSDCRLCDSPLLNISRLPVCEACIAAILPISGETCDTCGESLPGLARSGEMQTCGACQEERPQFARATAFGAYDGELRELIHLLKYEQVLPAAGVLGGMLAKAIRKLGVATSVLMVPVPLHSSKRRQRQFNQAELIASAALKKLAQDGFEFAAKVLVRVKPTVSQIGLSRPQRRESMRGAFRVVHPNRVKGQQYSAGGRCFDHGDHSVRVRACFAKSRGRAGMGRDAARTLKISDSNSRTEHELETQAS